MCADLRASKMHQTNITNDRRFLDYNPRGRRCQSFNDKCSLSTPSPLLQVSSRRVSAHSVLEQRTTVGSIFTSPTNEAFYSFLAAPSSTVAEMAYLVTDLPNTGINSDAISVTRPRCCEVTVLLNEL